MIRYFTAAAVFVALSACATHEEHQRLADLIKQSISTKGADQQPLDQPRPLPPIEIETAPVLGYSVPGATIGENLPPQYETPSGWTFNTRHAVTLAEVLERITIATGIPFEDDAAPPSTAKVPVNQANVTAPNHTGQAAPASATSTLSSPQGGAAAALDAVLHNQSPAVVGQTAAIPPAILLERYTGPLSKWLQQIMPRFGRHAEYRHGELFTRAYITRQYRLAYTGGTTHVKAGLSTSTSGGNSSTVQNGGVTSAQDVAYSHEIDPYQSFRDALASILPTGATYSLDPEGNLTVTTPSEYLQDRVANFVREYNARKSRIIEVEIEFLTITDSLASDIEFQPTITWGDGTSAVSIQGVPATGSAGDVLAKIVNPPKGSPLANFSGSSLLLQAMQSQGQLVNRIPIRKRCDDSRTCTIKSVTDIPVVTNSFQSQNQLSTLSQTTVSTIEVGTIVSFAARMLDDGSINVDLSWSISSVLSDVQVPQPNSAPFDKVTTHKDENPTSTIHLRPGVTELLLDQKQEQSDYTKSGTGPMWNWMLGGSDTISSSKTRQVVLVTARPVRTEGEIAER